ncbi:MAG: OmpA family protein [Vicinamibacterales bacterium]
MFTAAFAYIVQQTGSSVAAWMLIAGVILAFVLIAASVLNPERRGVRWLKALGFVAAVLAIVGSWRVEEPRAARTRAIAAQVPALEKRTEGLDARVKALEAENESLKGLNNTLKDQIGHEKSLAAEALDEADKKLRALADSLGDFDKTAEGVIRLTLPGDLVFSPNESTLRPEHREALARLVGFLILQTSLPLRNKVTRIRVVGHTDNTKLSDPQRVSKNQTLSEARALAVAEYLMKQNLTVPIDRDGKGMRVPTKANEEFATPLSETSLKKIDELNDDPDKQRANRRVELLLIKADK